MALIKGWDEKKRGKNSYEFFFSCSNSASWNSILPLYIKKSIREDKKTYHSLLYFLRVEFIVCFNWMKTNYMLCFTVLKSGVKKKITFFVKIVHSPLCETWKTQEKAWLSQVFSFSYLATQLWHGANLQKGFSQNILDARGREREEAGKTAGQWMFHYIWCCFPPKALSKVSERREPRPEMFKPLVTTWSKAALHFLIFALKWEPLHRSCVCEHSGAFYLTWFPRACLKVFCCLRRGRDTVRKGAIFLGW